MKSNSKFFLISAFAFLLITFFQNCSGGGGGGFDSGGNYYANWTCSGSGQCASVMGGPSGSQGPFSDYNSCYSWCQTYIPGACSCSGSPGAYNPAPSPTPATVTLTSIVVTPANKNIAATTTQQYAATGYYSDGSNRNLTLLASWSSSLTNVATINNSGLATSSAAGSTTISASYLGVTGSTNLTVNLNFSISGLNIYSGPPGSTLMIAGSNFNTASGATSVTVCGVTAAITSISSSQISVVVPSSITSPSTCEVDVTTSQGTAVSTNPFTVFSPAGHVPSVYFTDGGVGGNVGNGSILFVAKTGGASYKLSANLNNPQMLRTNGHQLFFAQFDQGGQGTVSKLETTGGAVSLLGGPFPVGQGPFDITSDATNFYYLNLIVGVPGIGQTVVMRSITTGIGPNLVDAYFTAGQSMAIDASNLYYATSSAPFAIKQVSLSGGANQTPLTLTTATPGYNPNVCSIVAVGANVYYIDLTAGTLSLLPVGGGTSPTTLVTGITATATLVTDGANLYWSDTTSIHKYVIATGIATTLISGIKNSQLLLAIDSTSLYYGDNAAVKSIGKNGGTPTTLAVGITFLDGLAVDP